MLPMSYRPSKPGLRYEEEKKLFCLKTNQKYVSDHGNISFIMHKSNLHFYWCGVFEPFKAWHVFRHSVPINHTHTAHMYQMAPRITRKYLSEQFKVTGVHNDDTLRLL